MRVVLQRVSSASVALANEPGADREAGQPPRRISYGLLLFVGMASGDAPHALEKMAEQIVHLRIFPDARGKFHRSVLDVEGDILAVPQFTLLADTSGGRRPSFSQAMAPEEARRECDRFVALLKEKGVRNVLSGFFGEHMEVTLVNDGPVTLVLEQ